MIMNILSGAIASIKVTQNRRIETEMAVIKICSPESSSDISSLFARIAELEKKIDDLSKGVSIVKTTPTPAVTTATQKPAESQKKSVDLSTLQFDDDSDEYPDEPDMFNIPPADDSAFFPAEPQFDEPVFDEIPSFDPEPVSAAPVFDEAPVASGPVFDPEPHEFQSVPVFDPEPAAGSTEFSQKTWMNCIIEAERICQPIIGHLLGTKAEVSGANLTITNYNAVLPMIFPIVKDKLTEAVATITGQNMSVRLG